MQGSGEQKRKGVHTPSFGSYFLGFLLEVVGITYSWLSHPGFYSQSSRRGARKALS